MAEALVEVLMATYQGARFVRAQLDSILAQTDDRWHLTVSDDGSTDGTDAILDEYAARFPERITRYRSGRRFGRACDHFLHLMNQCEQPYMLFCDQDDVWHSDKIGTLLDALLDAETRYGQDTPLLVYADQALVDEALRPIAPSLAAYERHVPTETDWRALLLQNVVTGGAMGVNRALAALARVEAPEPAVIMHDGWLAAVAGRFGHIVYIDRPLSDYRQHGDNSVGAQPAGSPRYIARMLSAPRTVRQRLVAKKNQAALFGRRYAARLTAEDEAFLQAFSRARSGPWFYWRNRRLVHGFWRLAGMMICG